MVSQARSSNLHVALSLVGLPASVKDIDIAVAAARKAFKTTWGKNVTGFERSALINKLADLIERDAQELAELESLDNGKPVRIARSVRNESLRDGQNSHACTIVKGL